MLKILITITLLIVSNQTIAKSKCELEWNALKAVQSQLRHKSSEYLRNKEHKKHKEYQDCRKGKKKKSYPKEKTYTKQSEYVKKYKYPIYSNNNIKHTGEIKGKFKGEKQDAWLEYYKTQIPQICNKPKDIKLFAQCVDHKNNEAKNFNIVWASRKL